MNFEQYNHEYGVRAQLRHLFIQKYERYLPTAFDESMSLLEKMNKLIEAQNKLIDVVNHHTKYTDDQLFKGFEIIDTHVVGHLDEFRGELEEQKRLYEEIRDKVEGDLLPDTVREKLETWLLDGTFADLINNTVFTQIIERLQEVELKVNPEFDNVQVRVPGDFDNLQDAMEYARGIKNGVSVEVLMMEGFRPSKGFSLEYSDLSNVTLNSVDSIVKVADNFTGQFMFGKNTKMPVLGCLIDMNDKGSDGYYIDSASSGYVKSGCGIKNSGATGLYVNNSVFKGIHSVFSHANDRNVWATRTAVVSLDGADLSYCKGGGVAVYVSRSSILEASNSDMSHSNAEYSTLSALRSKVTIMDADLSHSKRDGINASQASEVGARGVNLSDMGRHCVYADNGARVDLVGGVDISRSGGHAFVVMHGSQVTGKSVSGTDVGGDVINATNKAVVTISELNVNRLTGNGVYADSDSDVNVPGIAIYNVGKNGLYASSNSNINAGFSAVIKAVNENIVYAVNNSSINVQGAELTGAKKNSIECAGMSRVNAQSTRTWDNVGYGVFANTLSMVNIRNAYVVSTNTSILCQNGSQIVANGVDTASGGTVDASPTTFNTLTTNGVIFHKE